ncbi:sugar ABC transporter substrate-binding protein [Kineococcus sp. SYSU DK003]|uniref:sugar ABC transporter substrate-binding protein n=1 Tax=Kineococcus sp. SYSU DK003 TaxID=3383124 RepID=UPI003D7E1326
MHHADHRISRRALTAAGLAAPFALAACGNSGVSSDPNVLRVMDSYSNDPDNGIIGAALDAAAQSVGVTLERVSVSGGSLIQRVLQQGSSGTLPDILMLDNPDLQQIASTTALTPLGPLGVPTQGYAQGVLDAGTFEGEVYGLAPTVNTIALFYDVRALDAAGLTPPTTWEELREAAATLTTGGRYGFSFCANATYENTWQFLPFFWTNGGTERNLDTPEAAQALELLTDLVADGTASRSVLNWTQADVKDQFISGKAAMMVNGPWQLPEMETVEGLEYGIVTLPVRDPATQVSVAPLGGEVWTIPNTGNAEKEAKAAEVLTAFLSDTSSLSMGEQRYTVPGKPSLGAEYLQRRPDMSTFTDLITDARARTAELGEDWPAAAKSIYTAVQLALSGQATPAEALAEAEDYR